jgi:hypothetical protein
MTLSASYRDASQASELLVGPKATHPIGKCQPCVEYLLALIVVQSTLNVGSFTSFLFFLFFFFFVLRLYLLFLLASYNHCVYT